MQDYHTLFHSHLLPLLFFVKPFHQHLFLSNALSTSYVTQTNLQHHMLFVPLFTPQNIEPNQKLGQDYHTLFRPLSIVGLSI